MSTSLLCRIDTDIIGQVILFLLLGVIGYLGYWVRVKTAIEGVRKLGIVELGNRVA